MVLKGFSRIHTRKVVSATALSVAALSLVGASVAIRVAEAVSAEARQAEDQLKDKIAQWAAAWSAQDVTAYLDLYSQDFKPQDLPSRQAWARQRESRITKPERITVRISGLEFRQIAADEFEIRFQQHYTSPLLNDKTTKSLVWIREGEDWKILRERVVTQDNDFIEITIRPVGADRASISAPRAPARGPLRATSEPVDAVIVNRRPPAAAQAAIVAGVERAFPPTVMLSPLGLKFDPVLDLESSKKGDTPSYIFGRALRGQTDDYLESEGDAELRKLGLFIKADKLRHDLVQDELNASGDVKLFREGEFFEGPELSLKLGTSQGHFDQVRYQLTSTGSRGQARLAEFVQPMETRLHDASFTSCTVERPAWELRMSELLVDQIREVGKSSSTYLFWGDTPILPLGDVSFPIGNRRKTGFLSPSYAATSRLGLEVQAPFYWNIAPQHDLTLYPKVISRRGVQLGAEFRFLTPDSLGTLMYEVLPNDRVEGDTREFGRITATHRLDPEWSIGINAARASDDRYFADFGTSLLGASQRILPATLSLTGKVNDWKTQVSIQEYQLLQDKNAPLLRPYAWMPRVAVNKSYRSNPLLDRLPLDWNLTAEATSFDHPSLAKGQRFVAQGGIAYRHLQRGFYITPRLSVHATRYVHEKDGSLARTLQKYDGAALGIYQNNVGDITNSYSRLLPTFGLDISTVLERDSMLGDIPMEQTLEPRLSYVRTPYRDQSIYPVFDTASPSLNFAQIFSESAFDGDDRVADLNQLTLGVTTRFIENQTGVERLRASLGQRFYFSDQRVSLPGAATRTSRESDLLGQISTQFNRSWGVDLLSQYTLSTGQVQTASLVSRYTPAAGRTMSAAYRFVRDSSNTLDLAFQWPLSAYWYAVGRYNYSFKNLGGNSVNQRSGELEALAGVEYDGGCWVARAVAQRFVTGERERNTAIFFQIELNGMGRVGTNPLGALTRSIPNYQMINQITPLPAKFDNFQ